MPRLFAFALLLFAMTASANEPERPNVLFIAIDDLNDWVGCLGGHPQAATPNIDKLAGRGVLFANTHCAAPLCNPSRTAVMTGMLPSTSGVHGNEQDWHDSPFVKGHSTLPRWFHDHGYRTAACGKLFHANHGGEVGALNGGHGGLQGFDDFPAWDDRFPAKDRQLVRDAVLPGQNFNGLNIWHWDWGPIDVADDETTDGRAVTWAEEQLAAPQESPFFLAVGLYRPHSPMYVPRQYFEAVPLEGITLPLFPEDDLDDVPAIAKAFRGRPSDHHPEIVAKGLWDDAVQGYLANVAFVDAMVGRLIAALDASPHAKQTIVMLWSDHGWHLGEKGKWHKSTLWEEATRVPLIVVAPRVSTPGSRCERAVSLIDLYPTLCDLCGLPSPQRLDGASFVPLLREPEAVGHPPAVTVLGGRHAAVRTDRWRLIRYEDGSEELYDHDSDPNEWTNLASDSGHASVKEELARHLPETIRTFPENREFPNEPGFRPIFNGYDLTGWEGDERVWRVEEGAIVGKCPPGVDPETVPLVWKGSRLADFELRLRFQFEGEDPNTLAAVAYRADEKRQRWRGLGMSPGLVATVRSPGGLTAVMGKEPLYRKGEWNDVVLVLRNGQADHFANGHQGTGTSLEGLPATGDNLLICPHAGHGRVKFTDLRIRDLGGR